MYEKPVAAGAEVAIRIALEYQGSIRNSLREINQRVRYVYWISARASASRVVQPAERYLAVEGKVIQTIELYIPDVTPKLEGVLGCRVRQIVDPFECVCSSPIWLVNPAA